MEVEVWCVFVATFVRGGVLGWVVVLVVLAVGVLGVVLGVLCDWLAVVVGFGGYLIILVLVVAILLCLLWMIYE